MVPRGGAKSPRGSVPKGAITSCTEKERRRLRIQILERLGFEWVCVSVAWEDRLSELADFRKIHGHCNIKNHQLGKWSEPKGAITGRPKK
jgi:hypothetical protein